MNVLDICWIKGAGMSMKNNKLVMTVPYTMLALIALCMLLTGCLYEPSSVSKNRIQVEQEEFRDKVSVASLNDSALKGLATHYRRHGDGPLNLTVTYDPKAKTANAMHAGDQIGRLVERLSFEGVSNVDANILPVKDQGGEMQALISYTAYNALAPKDCGVLPGMRDTEADIDEEYKLGCSVDTLFAKQIARPKDLKGLGTASDVTDGRRLSNKLEVYRSGVPNEPLEGQTASEE